MIYLSVTSLLFILLAIVKANVKADTNSEFGAIFTHGHSIKGKVVRNCPKKVCQIDPSEKLYFWTYTDERFPHITLSTWSSVKIPISAIDIDFSVMGIALTDAMHTEITQKSDGRDFSVVEVSFSPGLQPGDYNLMFHDHNIHYLLAPMKCTMKIQKWWKPYQKTLQCITQKKQVSLLSI